jgi:CHAT domain-containing protein
VQAKTPDAFRQVRQHALLVVAEATKVQQTAIAFEAAVLAAHCTYRTLPVERQSQDQHWAETELADLTEAARRFSDSVSRPWFERYVNLLAATMDHLTEGVLPRIHATIENAMRRLAASAEQTIPPDFSYRVTKQESDPEGIATAQSLAVLSWRYGSADVARARLREAINRARQWGRVVTWLDLEKERYSYERREHPPGIPLQELRDEARSGAQGLRESYSSRAGRILVSAMFDQVYGQMLEDQLSSPLSATAAEIFRTSETLKARVLLNQMSIPPAELRSGNRAEAETLENEILGFAKGGEPEGDILREEMNLISLLNPFGPLIDIAGERQQRVAQLEQIYRKAGVGFEQAAKPAALEAVQQALEPKEAILEYVIPYNEFYRDQTLLILLITKDGVRAVHLSLDGLFSRNFNDSVGYSIDGKASVQVSPLSERVTSLRAEVRVNENEAARSDLKAFYQALIQPLVDRGFQPRNYDRLIIVPHGPLHYLPFSALMDDEGEFLVQKTAISIVPSASIWLRLVGEYRTVQNFVAFGNPSLNRPDLPSLQASENEVNEIFASLDLVAKNRDDIFVGEQATSEHFLREAPRSSLLHVATHGEFPAENALDRHGILLGQSGSDDGAVRASAVRKLNLTSTWLVVLSVCNGGLYRIGPADEPYGLVPAFLEAGSQNVVSTLWKVEDLYGRPLVTEFYKHVLKSGPAEALRQASLNFIGQGQTIRRWADFISIGPGRPFNSPHN